MKFKVPGGASGGGAYFADSFQRADQPFWIGNHWNMCYFSSGDGVSTGITTSNLVNVSASALTITGSAGVTAGFWAFPTTFNGAACNAAAQFAEWRVVSAVLAIASQGAYLMVFGNMNTGNGYWLRTQTPGGGGSELWTMVRVVGAVQNVLLGAGVNIAPNDILRFEITPSSSQNVLNIFQNGVQTGTFTDNDPSRPTEGLPGIASAGQLINATIFKYDLFKCGTLPQARTDANFP